MEFQQLNKEENIPKRKQQKQKTKTERNVKCESANFSIWNKLINRWSASTVIKSIPVK